MAPDGDRWPQSDLRMLIFVHVGSLAAGVGKINLKRLVLSIFVAWLHIWAKLASEG